MLADAEKRQVREEVVQVWLQKLEAASFEILDVLDKWNITILKSSLIDDDHLKLGANKQNPKPPSGFLVLALHQNPKSPFEFHREQETMV